jgi:FkbM family methyltransferase
VSTTVAPAYLSAIAFPPELSLALTLLLAILLAILLHKQSRTRFRLRQLTRRLAGIEADLVRARRRLYADEAARALAAARREPRLPIRFTSQYGEDLLLWDIFAGKLDGFFIEVGAYDGYTLSVTYPFESVGWRGVLIEALPQRAEQCRLRRPHSRIVHGALSHRGSSGTTTFTTIVGAEGSDMLSYLSTHARHTRLIDSRDDRRQTVTVPLTTMDDVLKDHPPSTPIDFAVIDVEGAELDLLDGFDLDRFHPRVLVIEDKTKAKDSPLHALMTARNYRLATWIGINRVYIRADQPELLRRATEASAVLEQGG